MNSRLLFDLPPYRPTTTWRSTALPSYVGSNHTSFFLFAVCRYGSTALSSQLFGRVTKTLLTPNIISSDSHDLLSFWNFPSTFFSLFNSLYTYPSIGVITVLYTYYLTFSIMFDQKISITMLRAMEVELAGS
jgi:hypothetical protein